MAEQLLRARTSARGIRDRMPLNSESLSTHSRQEFCLALKAARERAGITLAEIADKTKIPASLFAALERNDLRRWPKGLFRRSFFRDYARMIGVPRGSRKISSAISGAAASTKRPTSTARTISNVQATS